MALPTKASFRSVPDLLTRIVPTWVERGIVIPVTFIPIEHHDIIITIEEPVRFWTTLVVSIALATTALWRFRTRQRVMK